MDILSAYKNILSPVSNALSNVGRTVGGAVQGAENYVGNAVHNFITPTQQTPSYQPPLTQPGQSNAVQAYSNMLMKGISLPVYTPTYSQAMQAKPYTSVQNLSLTNALVPQPVQNYLQTVQKNFSTPIDTKSLLNPNNEGFNSWVYNVPVLGGGARMLDSVVNSPANTIQGLQQAGKIAQNPTGYTPQQYLATGAKIADAPLNLLTLGEGAAAKQLVKQGFKQASKEAAIQSGKYGALFGLKQGLQDNANTTDPNQYLQNVLASTGIGTAAGISLGVGGVILAHGAPVVYSQGGKLVQATLDKINTPEVQAAIKDQSGKIKLGPGEEEPFQGIRTTSTAEDLANMSGKSQARFVNGNNPSVDQFQSQVLDMPSLAEKNPQAIAAFERNNLVPTNTPTVENTGITLKQSARNAISEFFRAKQNIEQGGNATAQSVSRALKSPQDQELFRQTIEHPEIMNDSVQKASNPQAFVKAVNDFRDFTNTTLDQFNSVSDPKQRLGYLQNYYSHIIDLSTPEAQAKLDDFVAAKMRNYSGWFSKGRVFQDINELRDAGFELKNQTAAQDVLNYTQGTAKGASTNAFVNEIKKNYPNDVITMSRGSDGVALPAGFRQLDPENKLGLSGTFVSQRLFHEIGNSLGEGSALAGNKVVKVLDHVNQYIKEVQLGLGGFHAFKTTIRQAVNDPLIIPRAYINAFNPSARLAFRQTMIKNGVVDAAGKMGVTLGKSGDLLSEGASVTDKISHLSPIEKFNQGLFGGLIDTYKLNLVQHAMSKFDLNTPAGLQQARAYGAQINNLMGGINYTILNRNKTVQQLARFTILAPDFNEGKIRQVVTAFNPKDWTPAGRFAKWNLLGEAIVVAGLSEVGRKLTIGHFDNNFKDFVANAVLSPSVTLPNNSTFNNPKNGKTQVADLPGSDIADIARAIQDPGHFLQARGSALVSTATKLATGNDYFGNPLVDPFSGQQDNLLNRGIAIAKGVLPIPAVQGLNLAGGKTTPADAALNTVGFRVKNNPDDPKQVAATSYFNALKQASQGLDPNQLAIWNGVLHPTTKDRQGNPVIDKTAYTKPAYYSALLNNPDLLNREQQFQSSQPGHHPMWDLNPSQLKSYLQAQVINGVDPSGDTATIKALKGSLPADFNQKVSDFYNSLQSQGVSLPTNNNFVQSPPEVQQFWSNYSQLPAKGGYRAAALKTPLGQQALALIQQQTDLTNQQRANMGLPPLSSKYSTGSSSSGSNSGSSTNSSTGSTGHKKVRVKKVSIPGIKKLSVKQYKPAKVKVYKPSRSSVIKVKSIKMPNFKSAIKVKKLSKNFMSL